MPPPTPLVKATSSVTRLLKDEERYRTELADQESQLRQLKSPGAKDEGEDDEAGNREYMLRQLVREYSLSVSCFVRFLCIIYFNGFSFARLAGCVIGYLFH